MKKISRPLFAVILLPGALLLNSCATLFTGKTTPVILVNCPSDIKVYENGSQLSIEQVQSQVKSHLDESQTIYYASGLKLNKKEKIHNLTFESNGVKKDHQVKLKVDGGLLFLDLFLTGPIGITVDAVTKKWRKAKDRHIDVAAVVAGKEPMSQRKLKKIVRRNAHS